MNILAEGCNVMVRYLLSRTGYQFTPNMIDDTVYKVQVLVFLMQVIMDIIIFYLAERELRRYKRLIPKEDREELARLQQDALSGNLSTLTMENIDILIKLWALILIGVQCVYEITAVAYKDFIENLISFISISDENTYFAFVSIYNSTHGFKYAGMFIAIIIGVAVTGIFLKDRTLGFISVALTVAFMIAFLFVEQSTFVVGTRLIGVVWTSAIFHILETLGLFVLAVYLRIRYRGM